MSVDWIPTGAARQIPAKERGNRGLFPSIKVPNGLVEYESCLERDFFLLCHHSPDVMQFQHQPITISYTDRKKKARKYTPDAYVEFSGGKKGLFEVKYESEVIERGEEFKERWSVAREWSEMRGITFFIITEREIRTPRWYNVWFTLGSSKCNNMDYFVAKLAHTILDEGERYDEVCYKLAETLGVEINKAAQILCYAIYHGLVFVDTFSTMELSNSTIVRKKKRGKLSPFRPLWAEFQLPPNVSKQKTERIFPVQRNSETQGNVLFKVPPQYEERVKLRLKIVKSWLNRPKQKRTPHWRDTFCTKWHVSEKTIYRWVREYRKAGLEGLVPKHGRAGRPQSISEKSLTLMEKSRLYFLKPLKNLKNAYAKLEKACGDQDIPLPPFPSFKRYIYARTTAAEFAKKRGRKYHKAAFTPSLASFQGGIAPLQVVQMDNTSFDVFPVDSEEREGLPTPNMTVAMDCYSRMVTGFSISFFPSSARTVLDVLVQTILPKTSYTQAYETEQDWPIVGFPVLLLLDNGMDYRARDLQEFCIKYDVIVEYAPIRTPRYKAFIEQWFNILHNALVTEEVAGFRPHLKQRLENPELEPETEAILTLQEIEEWLHRWVLDEYHFTNPYEDRAPAPFLRWQTFRDGKTDILLPLPREPPVDRKEIDLLFLDTLKRFERVLRSDGVVWHHLKYNNTALANLYRQIGNSTVEVLHNPRDIRVIWVVNPVTSQPVMVGLGSGWAQAIADVHRGHPIHESAWKAELRLVQRGLKKQISPYSYQREISQIKREQVVRGAKARTKRVRKEREKVKETTRKSITTRIKSRETVQPEEKNNDSPDEKPRRQVIDWSKVGRLPTDDFPKEV